MSFWQKQTVLILQIKVCFFEIIQQPSSINVPSITAKRKDKQSLRLLRGSERDLKLDIASAQLNSMHDHGIDSYPPLKTPQPSVQIESCKQFKSLCSKLVTCPKKTVDPLISESAKDESAEQDERSQNRVEFHKMLSLLIRMGCGEKQVQERANPRRIVGIILYNGKCNMISRNSR